MEGRPQIPRVGMRTVKTAVAVMLSYLVFAPFGLVYREELGGILGQMGPLYACIACIVCMQGSLELTMQQGISRFVGVAVGGTLGGLTLTLGGVAGHPVGRVLLLGLVCVAGIWVCLLIKRPAACGMACIVPCIILVNHMSGVERYYYAAARVIETAVGVAVALAVNAALPDHRGGGDQAPALRGGGKLDLEIGREQAGERRAVEELLRRAFWNVYTPGCSEHYLAHVLRGAEAFLPELDLVARGPEGVLGVIMYTKAHVSLGEREQEVLCLGPVGVEPDHQGRGIGGALIRYSLAAARERGFGAVLLYGDPDYYARFGFRETEQWGIRDSEGKLAAALLGLELIPGALSGLRGGRFLESSAFQVVPDAVERFDRNFPPREKGWSPSQERFQALSSQRRD